MNQIIYCPVCHQRLFDAAPSARGSIEIKCPRCRRIQQICLHLPGQPPDDISGNKTE